MSGTARAVAGGTDCSSAPSFLLAMGSPPFHEFMNSIVHEFMLFRNFINRCRRCRTRI
jgi:hypothetical protein